LALPCTWYNADLNCFPILIELFKQAARKIEAELKRQHDTKSAFSIAALLQERTCKFCGCRHRHNAQYMLVKCPVRGKSHTQ
jgi:hypothetical protein